MDDPLSLQEKLLHILKKNIFVSALLFGGLIILSIGLIQYFGNQKAQVEFQKGEDVMSASTSAEASKIYVDVSGSVENPGVYMLSDTARVQDAITAAGGLSQDADSEYLARSVNLAAPLKDGVKIYIPRVGENGGTSGGNNATTLVNTSTQNGMVSINTASSSELEALPGIGTVTAGKIITSRPYGSVEELLSKKVVGKSVYDKIKDQISL